MKLFLRSVGAALLLLLVVVAFFAANVALGMRAHAQYTGTISGLALRAPVQILRDDRGVPHLRAQNEHDLFFAQGYVEGSDRLFQLDLLRRFVKGQLAEVLGRGALASDQSERAVPVKAMVAAQWSKLDARQRAILGAFADGVNAAMDREPLPVEFRILAYKPRAWTPEDSLSVSMASVLDLIDDWDEIASRDAVYRQGGSRGLEERYPLTDPCYDAPVVAGLSGVGPGRACKQHAQNFLRELADARPPVGSNEWAAGAAHTATGRALLANDPHLGLRLPGVWYLIDLQAPGFHVAGATFPGNPGVVLGHNEHVAWGATDGTTASLSAFEPPAQLDPNGWQTESFDVRFSRPVTTRYYRTPREFGVTTSGGKFVLVHWSEYDHPSAPGTTFEELDRAASVDEALADLSRFTGPTHNFVVADTSGRAAYALAGPIPNDPVWARWIHPATDLSRAYPAVPQALMPEVPPARDAVLWTANNRIYGENYPLRLSAQFAAPYRAYRVAELLRARKKYDVAYFAQMQMDVRSLPERELAHELAAAVGKIDPELGSAMASWDGEMRGDSTTATVVESLRVQLTDRTKGRMMPLLAHARIDAASLPLTPLPSPAPWSIAGAVPVLHAFNKLGMDFLDGTTLPGNGDAFTLHVQYPGYSQSFRAVWDIGNWDAGGITLPQGESGQPGSGHYTDQAPAWIAGRLWPLPFSNSAVQRTAIDRETLAP